MSEEKTKTSISFDAIKILKTYYLIIAILCYFIGIAIQYHFGLKENPLISILARNASNVLIALGTAFIISQFFIKAIDATEKANFMNKIVDIQKQTAADAINSTFERLIDDNFLKIIKADILQSNFVRRNLRWNYDISLGTNKNQMSLLRTINYQLHNITGNDQFENLKMLFFENVHSKANTRSIKYKLEGSHEFTDVKATSVGTYEKIKIPANSFAEIVIIFEQIFDRTYIYETHSTQNGAIDLELTVTHPAGYTFDLISQVMSSKMEEIVNTETKKVYRFSGAIYKGQGIEFLCAPDSSKLATKTA